ncbi:MAG: YitT family protein [Syntrophales bacterium]|nr:YitT family protein [Syntrophales bacterium]MDD4339896.1 YitT family protein [Syntrophales bacterium]HOG07487.1 YitT family protein [Syntrophales bacterium]HPB69444.1 YitT family protein [Syntrophales bacterium]HQN25705.1 YitT family protein [Syntrophales bacterium]
MTKESKHTLAALWPTIRQAAWTCILLAAGSAICAAAVNGILIPREFVSGGFTGLALVLHYLWPLLPVSVLYFLFNVPLFVASWFFVGRRFFAYSVVGMAVYAVTLDWVRLPIPVTDPLLSALLAGILMGIGMGIILRSTGSAGGTDILSVILYQRWSVRPGATILASNLLILILSLIFFSLEIVLYTLIYLYVSSQIIDIVVMGLSRRKVVFVISREWEAISRRVLKEIDRGLTILHGEGGYSGHRQQVLYTVVTFRELGLLKRIVREADPAAFVVVTDTQEVMGPRIGNQPPW